MQHINNTYHRWPVWLSVAYILLIWVSATNVIAQQASPMQAGHYYPVLINTRDMVNPPSGLFFLWDNFVVNSNKYFDRNGNEFKNIPLSELHPAFPDIDVSPKLTG